MCSYQDGWFDSFVWAEGRKNKLCPSLHMKPISIYYACTSFWAWYSGLWSQRQLWHWLQCAHPRRATSIISYSLVEVFFGHKLPISTQVTVSQKLFFLPLSGLFLSIFFSMAFSFFSCMCVCKCTKFTQIVSMQTDQEWREDVLYLLIPFRCQTATPLV